MNDMRSNTPVVPISQASPRARAQRRMRELASAARTAASVAADPGGVHPAYPESPRHGRAWLNGAEIGGYDRRYAHLTRAYE